MEIKKALALQTTHTETDLLRLLSQGDEPAFRQLFDRYRDKIYSLGMYLTRSETLSEEIVQDVFIRVWEKREQLAGITYFNAWLRTVARNICSNYLRSIAVEQLAISRYMQQSHANTDTPENTVISKEYQQIIDNAIKHLSTQQKKVYLLSRETGKKQEEIAAELKISLYTVKEYLKLARQSIRQYMENHIDKAILLALALYC